LTDPGMHQLWLCYQPIMDDGVATIGFIRVQDAL
jgi:hypothetical protein